MLRADDSPPDTANWSHLLLVDELRRRSSKRKSAGAPLALGGPEARWDRS
jgi:hypothetical protein